MGSRSAFPQPIVPPQSLRVLPEPSRASIGSSVQPVFPEPVPHGGGPRVRCLAPVNLRLAEDAQPLGARERALVRPRREGPLVVARF